jgi:hypothetical protein
MREPLRNIGPDLKNLIAQYERYAEATGDNYYLVRSANNIGMRLIEFGPTDELAERGNLAVELARKSLAWLPTHVHTWALWRDALETQGHYDPEKEFADFIAGYARVEPYGRAETPDAARMLFGPLASTHGWRAGDMFSRATAIGLQLRSVVVSIRFDPQRPEMRVPHLPEVDPRQTGRNQPDFGDIFPFIG